MTYTMKSYTMSDDKGNLVNRKEGEDDAETMKSKHQSIVRLSTGRCNANEYDGSYDSSRAGTMEQLSFWWKKKRKRIFRKKTIYMRFPILQWLPKYSFKKDLVADLIAGLTIAITVIPQGLAYATVAGLPPEYGLYASYMGSFVYVIFGSTKVITIGPTSLLSLASYDAVVSMGPEAAILLTFLSGLICLLLGLLNLGFLIEFIAAPVIAGFTTAAAFTIGTSQVKSLLGLKFEADGFVDTWAAVFEHIEETRIWDAVMGFSCITLLLLLRVIDRFKLGDEENPSPFQKFFNGSLWFIATSRNAIIIVIASIIGGFLCGPGVEPINYPFYVTGNVTGGLPPFQLPPFFIQNGNETLNFGEVCTDLGSALFVVPLVTILESVSIAKSFARGTKVDASQEMVALGISNVMGSFVSSYPITGSFSRTAVNYASGVHTALGGIFTGSIVLLAITVLTPYFYYIPKSSLAAVIICAVIFMVEVHLMKLVWRSRKIDLIPLLATFLCCVFINLEIGILIGTAVNLAMLLYATARPRIKLYKINGPATEYLMVTPDRSLVFTSMDYFMSTVRKAAALHPKIPVVIDLSYVSIADFTTAYGVNNLTEDLHKRDHAVILTRAQPRVLTVLLGVEPDVHVHREGMDLDKLIKDILSPPEVGIVSSIESLPEGELGRFQGIDGPCIGDD